MFLSSLNYGPGLWNTWLLKEWKAESIEVRVLTWRSEAIGNSLCHRWEGRRKAAFLSFIFLMAKISKVCQILLALWWGLRCLGVMTITSSYDHDVICPVDTAGFCTWTLHVSTGKFGNSSEMQQERRKISSCLVWFSWITVPAITAYTNYSSTGRKRGQERERREKREGRKKERSRALGSREQPASLSKTLPSACSPFLCVVLGGVAWQHRTSQKQGNSTLTSAEDRKCFSPNQSTAGFSIKNTPKQLWVMPNKFNNWGNDCKWQLQNTKQTWKLMA